MIGTASIKKKSGVIRLRGLTLQALSGVRKFNLTYGYN
jgi:hypothetical protein